MLKILHTADWHIGQTFHEYDRTFEHQQFLIWLVNIISEKQIDVLLVSGDVFDGSNPTTTSVNLWYQFLADVTKQNPQLQIIITAGNHDSAARLEAPNPFFEYYNIRIVGNVQKHTDCSFDHEKLLIPIKNNDGNIKAWCMAVPFLRPGDYPFIEGATLPYAAGVTALYNEAFEYALNKQQQGQAIIAMGHLHTLGTEKSGNDTTERSIMGGVEFVPAAAFNDNIAYTALGHIHKAQKIGGKENIRYSGSPLPMSFSEINYKHQVILFNLVEEKATDITTLEVPVTIALLRVPDVPKKLSDVLIDLNNLPDKQDDISLAPYLEVRVLMDGPEPSLRHQIENVLKNKQVRLTRIDVNYPVSAATEQPILSFDKLKEMQPLDVFATIYHQQFKVSPPEEIIKLFNEVAISINK